MQSLNAFVSNKIFKSAIVPIVLIEILLIMMILGVSIYQDRSNQALVLERSQMSFQALSMQVSKRMEQEFENVKKDTGALRQIIEGNFIDKIHHKNTEKGFCFDGGFYSVSGLNKASVYTTNVTQLRPEDKQNLHILALSVSPIDALLNTYGKKIDAAWVNIGRHYSLFYPPIDLKEKLSPDLDATKQSYYFKADMTHNPDKKTLFIPLFQESWALSMGQIGAVVSPIYIDGEMKGVVGVSLTSENTQKLSDIELPFNAYVMITDADGYLLFSSNEARSREDFHVSSFTGLYKEGKEEALKMFTRAQYARSDYLFHEHDISDTGLKLILATRKSEVSKGVMDIFDKTREMGFLVLLFIFVLHVYLYRKLKLNTQKMTDEISGPVSAVSSASHMLFQEAAFKFQKSDIQELNVLHVNLEKAHTKLISQLYMDGLTQLPNEKKLLMDIEGSDDNLILISIDNLKNISNAYGTRMADRVLLDFVLQLGQIKCGIYKLYKVSHDVLALLGKGTEPLSCHYQKIENMTLVEDNISIVLNVSLSSAQADNTSELSLLARAQIALDMAKSQQHFNYLVFDEHKHLKDYKKNLQWAKRLQDAFDADRLIAYFQPIYNIKTQKVRKFESLVRMIEGDQVISPFFFLGSAARMGKLSDITRLMLKQVFAVSLKYPDVEFSINVSFEDFEQADLLKDIKALMGECSINANNIIFELLETGTLSDENKIIETIKALKELGCKIAIDDFGAGNSNFAHLMLMNVDYIKIDGQFVKNIHSDKQSLNITKTIKAFADMTGAQTIAEFVSQKEILEVIEGLEVDFAQGYYISEPKPAEEIEAMLNIGPANLA